MSSVLFPVLQIPLITEGDKLATLRKPSFKVNPNLSLKFLSNFKFGVWGEVDNFKLSFIDIESLDKELANKLGYATPKEYLLNNDWGVNGRERLLIEWNYESLSINWESVRNNQQGGKQ